LRSLRSRNRIPPADLWFLNEDDRTVYPNGAGGHLGPVRRPAALSAEPGHTQSIARHRIHAFSRCSAAHDRGRRHQRRRHLSPGT
jgi:hypothetical protein